MSPDRTELVPIGEAARILGVSVDTLRRWESKGIIAATRTPLGQRRFATSEIERVAAGDAAFDASTIWPAGHTPEATP